MQKSHTDREYGNQLKALREHLLMMAARVEEMIVNSVRSLVEQDTQLAAATIEADHKVNRCEVETDELCLLTLAKRQPMASDLRFITLSLKMVTDLERIGDLAVNICERTTDLGNQEPLVRWDDITRMSELVRSMVRDAIDAFVDRDVDKAQDVIERDDQVDELYIQAFRRVLNVMTSDPSAIERGIHIQSIVKWLERMADHTTNLAEQVIFMVKGKDIRHMGRMDEEL